LARRVIQSRLKRKFPSVGLNDHHVVWSLCGGGCGVALLDEETFSAVVTAFELCFSCALFHVVVSDDGNDDNTRLSLVVTCNPLTTSGTRPYPFSALHIRTCILCVGCLHLILNATAL
jgi:hypothetical protein